MSSPTVHLWHTEGLAISGILSWMYRLRYALRPELGVDVRLVDVHLEPYESRQVADRPGGFYDERITNVPALLAFLDRTRDDVHVINYGYHCLIAVERLMPTLVGRLRLVGMCHTAQDYYYANIRRFAAHLRAVVAVSDECAAGLAAAAPDVRDRITVMPVAVAAVPPARDGRREAGPLRLLYAGRIEQHQKRVGDLVEVAAALGRLGANAELSIVGDGRDRAGLEAFASQRTRTIPIAFHDARPPWEMDAVYQTHDVLLLVSEFEGASVSITEAMLHGLVPVATRTPGGHPILRDGENCLLADVGDVPALAAHAARLAADASALDRMGRAARADALAYQRADRHTERFEALVRAIAAAPPAASAGAARRAGNL